MNRPFPFPEDAAPILIVEDSPTQAEELKFILEKNGHRLLCARNGREALDLVARQAPSLVISDIVMPEMDGYQLCRRLKEDARLREIPVILLTSLSDPVDVVRGLECGADNFVFKPYAESYLLSRIAYILANRHLRETESTRMGVEVFFAGRRFFITSDRLQILNLLLSTYETAVERNRALSLARDDLRQLNETLELRVQERTSALRAEMAERRQAAAQVREQAELLNKARDAIVATDLEHRITYWNASAERLYGWSAAEVLGRRIEDLGLGLSHERFAAAYAALLARGEWRGEYELRTRAGERRQIETTWSLVFDEANRPRSILSIDTDVTEQKTLAEGLMRAQRIESIGLLASGIAHDVNNALSPILMASELLLLESDDPQKKHLLEMIRGGALRSTDMVKQILTFARGDGENPRRTILTGDLCSEVGEICRRTFPRHVQTSLEIAADVKSFAGDPTQMHQALLNLCVNARDAMPEGGTLAIGARNEPAPGASAATDVVLTVTDTGTGMPPEVIARIFEPFFTTKKIGKGTGLGLSMVRMIVKQHGGTLAVESEPGRGTRFTIRLPAVSSPEKAAPESAPAPLPAGSGELVLVVDHEAAIRALAAQTLETYGYRVLTATHGTEAIALCRQHAAELRLMIVDASMPVMDGAVIVPSAVEILPQLRVILTGGDAALSQRAESTDHLPKPYTPADLLHAVHQALSRPQN